MAPHPVVGPLFSAHLIEEAVIAQLRDRLPGYLSVACEEHGISEGIAPIKSWGLTSDYQRWPEQGLPALIVVCSGVVGEPEKDGGGAYRASWSVGVAVTVSGDVPHLIRRHAQVYAAAVRGAILQRKSLDGTRSTEWTDEAYADVPNEKERTMVAAANTFVVTQEDVVSWKRGPGSQGPPIPDAWPTVKETHVETEIQDP